MDTSHIRHQTIAIDGARCAVMVPQQLPARRVGLTLWKLRRVQLEIDAHLSETITNRQLANCVHLSPYHFARAFRQSTGMSPHGYVLRCRIEHAMHLMLATDATLCEIASECGFSDQSHLSRRFAEALGTPPRTWRRERKGGCVASAPPSVDLHEPISA